jgi:hypothetical protein
MNLVPFRSVDSTPFTTSREQLLRTRGRPLREQRNDVGLNEMDYHSVVFRFQDNGRLEEITLQAPVLTLGSVAVPFQALAGFVREQDPEAFERAGFLVSPRLGIAFDPSEPHWVTALAAHCIAEWRKLR